MPRYFYRAKQGPNKVVEGEIVADTRQAAVERIDRMGCSPILVEERTAQEDGRRRTSGRGIRARDINVFTRQLASMIKAGVSILRALHTIQEQTENTRLAAVAGEIEETIRDGKMLSEALLYYPRLFPELYVNLVRSGEAAGVLDKILLRLADAREKEDDIRKKVQAALAYPALMLAMGVLTVFVMVAFLLPRISGLFPKTTDLPLPTQILLAVSDAVAQHWYLGLMVLLLALLALRQIGQTTKGRQALHRFVLQVPLVGTFIKQADLARFARTLSLLVETGIPIDRALDLGGATLSNAVLRAEIAAVRRETIEQGSGVAAGLRHTRQFPPFVVNMIAVGEETGSLEESLSEIAGYYEREVDLMTRLVTTLLEPVLILFVGVIVGFIIFAMLLPIFQIGQAIG